MTRPTASELLGTARGTLLRELLPALPQSLNYEARMIANAMAIAMREAEQPYETQSGLSDAHIKELLPQPLSEAIPVKRQLCQALREGAFDENNSRQRGLLSMLYQDTQRKLAISNPKALRK